MAKSEGRVVRADVKESSQPMNLHDLMHNSEQLEGAVAVRIADVVYMAGGYVATVEIENTGSGHMVPTGIPNREVVLRVEARRAGGASQRLERSYKKVLAGPDGKPLVLDYEAFLYATSVVSDNRLRPKEPRVETFRFEVPPGEAIELSADVVYQYRPLVLDRRSMVITMASAKRSIEAASR
jgi:hypothetical protein